jgi:hypothetical protein
MGHAGAAFGIDAKAAGLVDASAVDPKPPQRHRMGREPENSAVSARGVNARRRKEESYGPTIRRQHPRGRHGAPWRRTTNSRHAGSVAPRKRAESLPVGISLHRHLRLRHEGT